MEKDKRITIRLSKDEYITLKEEADNEGMTTSDYSRNMLFRDNKNNVLQNLYYEGQIDLQSIKKELIHLENCIEKLPQIRKNNREYIKERIENIWLMLK